MPTVPSSIETINITFFGKHPLFRKIASDLERAGCQINSPTNIKPEKPLYMYSPPVATYDQVPSFHVGPPTQEPKELPTLPEQVTTPDEALQYARAYLEAHGCSIDCGMYYVTKLGPKSEITPC